jgi:long-chain fatty acid transport protein
MKFETTTTWIATVGAATVLCTTGPAWGAGFQINEQSARATGRASSVTATIDDPSAVWHNPAGLANIEGMEFMIGTSIILPDNDYEGPGFPSTNPNFPANASDQTLDSAPAFVPHAYAAYALSDKAVVGLGFYPTYGLGTFWQPDPGFVARTQADETELRTFFVTPAVALKPLPWLNVAVGLQLVPSTLRLEQAIGLDDGNLAFPGPSGDGSDDGEFELSATAFGVGATAGFQIKATENLRFGFNYRSAVQLNFEGDADFRLPDNVPPEIAAGFPDQGGTGSVTLPHSMLIGIGWEEEGSWVVETSVQITLWQSFEELALNFESDLTPDVVEPRDWNAVPLIRLGGEFMPIEPLALRAGIAYDFTPQPDRTVEPGLPDGNRLNLSAGVGYTLGAFTLDVSYLGIILSSRDIPDDSEFPLVGSFGGGFINLFAASLRVRI